MSYWLWLIPLDDLIVKYTELLAYAMTVWF